MKAEKRDRNPQNRKGAPLDATALTAAARQAYAGLTGDLQKTDAELARLRATQAALAHHHRDKAARLADAITGHRGSAAEGEYLDQLRQARLADALEASHEPGTRGER